MDVVADTSAVRGVVVGAEDIEFGRAAEHGVDSQRHQVGFRAVVLAEATGGVGAGGVEVAQAGDAQAVDPLGPGERAFEHPFALAIGRAGGDGGVLVDQHAVGRHAVRRAEQGGGGGEHEARHAMADARIDQRQAVADIGGQRADRVAHAVADQRESGEVEDGVPVALGEHRVERRGVGQLGFDQAGALQHGFAVASGEIVEHDDVRTLFEQGGDEVAADEAGTTGDEETARHGHDLK